MCNEGDQNEKTEVLWCGILNTEENLLSIQGLGSH